MTHLCYKSQIKTAAGSQPVVKRFVILDSRGPNLLCKVHQSYRMKQFSAYSKYCFIWHHHMFTVHLPSPWYFRERHWRKRQTALPPSSKHFQKNTTHASLCMCRRLFPVWHWGNQWKSGNVVLKVTSYRRGAADVFSMW